MREGGDDEWGSGSDISLITAPVSLPAGVTILVATPGRLLDHLRTTQAFVTQPLRWLVVDEADRTLDMGFEDTITEILAVLRERCPGLRLAAPALAAADKADNSAQGEACEVTRSDRGTVGMERVQRL